MVNPKTEKLRDDFYDNSLDLGKWINYGGIQVVETNHELEITNTITAGYYYIDSLLAYNLTGSYVFVKLVVDNPALLYNDPSFLVFIDGDNYITYIIQENVLYAEYCVGGVPTLVNYDAYDATNHKWLRMRESGGTTYWDTSPDGLTWTNFTSAGNPIVFTNIYVELSSGAYADTTGTTIARFSDLNIVEIPTCWFGM
jgi:hypothetical protein